MQKDEKLKENIINERINKDSIIIDSLLKSPKLPCKNSTPSQLPNTPGIYVFFNHSSEAIRGGRKDDQTLRDRIYRNHLMGNQQGNLRVQLIKSGVCQCMDEAKKWIRNQYVVQYLELQEIEKMDFKMHWAEHFMLAILQPKLSN